MSKTENAVERTDLIYNVVASYHVVDINDKGLMEESKKPNQNIKLYKLQRRNMVHSKLAMLVLNSTLDDIDLSQEFVRCCVVDESVKNDILGDAFACVEIFNKDEVIDDFKRFFEGWEYYQALKKKALDRKSVV